MKQRLDQALATRGITSTRSQAESWIKLGRVTVNGVPAKKTGQIVGAEDVLTLNAPERYVSRAGLKLASVADKFHVNFEGKIVLDVGSSTGGFTDYALQHGAKLVYAVDVGTDQLHPSLHGHRDIELHEKTDIRSFTPDQTPDIIVIDVSFVSLKDILPAVAKLAGPKTAILAMVKPQFEAQRHQIGSSGVIKNDSVRRAILKDFEQWTKRSFLTIAKADSEISGAHGNKERFYLLQAIYKS
jgi:23S rRNA (cytidine1920-2'-O)/16S rRNA (cytidine1409-2'-O)-methyltransferase